MERTGKAKGKVKFKDDEIQGGGDGGLIVKTHTWTLSFGTRPTVSAGFSTAPGSLAASAVTCLSNLRHSVL